jgi:peptidoglycan hydrolase CwlO-like protein
MNSFSIILAQSVTGPVLMILALLLVAGIIGYFTAWFYAKSVYTPVIKNLEAEKAELLRQVAVLKDDIVKINGQVDKLNEKIGKLEEEISEKEKEIKKLSKNKTEK